MSTHNSLTINTIDSDLYVSDLIPISTDDLSSLNMTTILTNHYWELLGRGTISVLKTQ